MKILIAVIAIVLSSLAFADHYTGTYQSAQGMTVNIQHSPNGQMQGSITGSGMQLSFQGQGNQQGAYGSMMSPQGVMGFQAQLSPDGGVLQMALYRMNQQGQPDQASVQQFTANRVSGGAIPQFGGNTPTPQPPFGGNTPTPQPPFGGNTPIPQPPLGNQPVPQPPFGGSQPLPPIGGEQPPFNPNVVDPAPFPAGNAQADWSGSYSNGQMTLSLQGTNGTYQGSLTASGQQMSVQGWGDEFFLDLQIQTANGQMQAYLERYEGQIYLVTDTQEFVLQQVGNAFPGAAGSAPVNPLGN